MSIPETFRPREFFQIKHFPDHVSMAVAVRIRFHYESIVIALSRITLHLEGETFTTRRSASKNRLIHAARTVIELTRYIDTEAHAPIWYVNCALVSTFSVFDENTSLTIHSVIGSMPLSALFILFDFVVHNPTHPETKSNLSLLGIVAGYFCRLEYASRGSLPSSLLSNFAGIARQYVDDLEANGKLQPVGAVQVDMDAASAHPRMDIQQPRNPSSSADSVSCPQPRKTTQIPLTLLELNKQAHPILT